MEPVEGDSSENIPFLCTLFAYINETHVLVPEMNLLYVNDIHVLNSCVNGCLDFIPSYLSL